MKKSKYIVLIAILSLSFIAIAIGLFKLLSTNTPAIITVNSPLPVFTLPHLNNTTAPPFTPEQMQGKNWLLNVWASWCLPCKAEHATLMRLAGEGHLIVGINYKDDKNDAVNWLQQQGNPYHATIRDTGNTFGHTIKIFGVPETYIIDKDGIVQYKHIGPIAIKELNTVIRPLLLQSR